MSPCGQRLAWERSDAIFVRDRRHSWQTSARLPVMQKYPGSICWSHDSNHICQGYNTEQGGRRLGHLLMDVCSGTIQHIALGQTDKDDLTAAPYARWAPSGGILAVYPFPSAVPGEYIPANGLLLVEASGKVRSVAEPQQAVDGYHLGWAADSRYLLRSLRFSNFSICDTSTQQQQLVNVAGRGSCAWSPSTWHEPQLLFVGDFLAQLFSATGQLVGTCTTDLKPDVHYDEIFHSLGLVWGQHGVIVVDQGGLWLCALDTSCSFQLGVRHHLELPGLRCCHQRLGLSPDHLQLALGQAGGAGLYSLLLVNVISGHLHVLEQLEHIEQRVRPCWQWSRTGCTLAFAFTIVKGSPRTFLKLFNFVF